MRHCLILHDSAMKNAGVDMEFAPKDLVQPSVCTPITHLYFCPAYWHLGSIGFWCNGGSAAKEPAAELPQVSAWMQECLLWSSCELQDG